MCLIAWSWRPGCTQTLLLAANRDEWMHRPTLPMRWWRPAPSRPDMVLSGQDLRSGGIWLGLGRHGRFAAVTNVRDPSRERPLAPSRGRLPLRYLLGMDPHTGAAMTGCSPHRYAEAVLQRASDDAGFNLLLGDAESGTLVWLSNQPPAMQDVEPGTHGLSNAALNTPWPKVQALKRTIGQQVEESVVSQFTAMTAALHDNRPAPDSELPNTGVSLAWERGLSAPFIRMPDYGTRCSTLLRLDHDGNAHVREIQYPSQTANAADFSWNWRKPGNVA